jgi:hypothetical protein
VGGGALGVIAARSATVGWYGVQLSSFTVDVPGAGAGAPEPRGGSGLETGGGGDEGTTGGGSIVMMRIGVTITAGASGLGGSDFATATGFEGGGNDGAGGAAAVAAGPDATGAALDGGGSGREISSSGILRVILPRRRVVSPPRDGGGSCAFATGTLGEVSGSSSIVTSIDEALSAPFGAFAAAVTSGAAGPE